MDGKPDAAVIIYILTWSSAWQTQLRYHTACIHLRKSLANENTSEIQRTRSGESRAIRSRKNSEKQNSKLVLNII